MKQYHKIQTMWKRDMQAPGNPLLVGHWATAEFEYLRHAEWIYTEKVDGTNIRIMYHDMYRDNKVTFGGKSDNAQLPARLVANLNEMFPDSLLRDAFDCDACLYGEGYGAGIQKGGNYRQDQSFVLFDVRIGSFWLRHDDVLDVAKKLEIDAVPCVGVGTLDQCAALVVDGFQSAWGDFQAEGIVARPAVHLCGRNGERIITKLKHKDFINVRVPV